MGLIHLRQFFVHRHFPDLDCPIPFLVLRKVLGSIFEQLLLFLLDQLGLGFFVVLISFLLAPILVASVYFLGT